MELSTTELLKLAAGRAGKSISKLSEELGFNTRAALNSMVLRGTMQLDLIQSYLNCCGYRLVAVPVDQEEPNALEIAGRDIE